ncbi:MAG TPA: PKD domain-containing protein, partial [Thermoplasmata archaeon]|nr:PKD domain-containing protein [Thermoplasmata archaeon]
ICSAATFDRWSVVGGVTVGNSAAPNTTLQVSANGSLAAIYTEVGAGPVLGSFTVVPSPVVVGRPVQFNASVLGGTLPYTFAYSGLPAGCTSADTPTLECTPLKPGRFFVSLRVTDALGASVVGEVTLSVNRPVSPPLVGAFLASVEPLLVGQSTELEVYVDGGIPPYSFYYYGLPGGCNSANTGNLSCSPTSVGLYHVTVLVADSTGAESSATVVLQVGPSGSWIARAAANPTVWAGASMIGGLLLGVWGGWYFRGRKYRRAAVVASDP